MYLCIMNRLVLLVCGMRKDWAPITMECILYSLGCCSSCGLVGSCHWNEFYAAVERHQTRSFPLRASWLLAGFYWRAHSGEHIINIACTDTIHLCIFAMHLVLIIYTIYTICVYKPLVLNEGSTQHHVYSICMHRVYAHCYGWLRTALMSSNRANSWCLQILIIYIYTSWLFDDLDHIINLW